VPTLELYDREDCPYSKRVRDTLDELGVEYEETLVPNAHKNRTEVEQLTGQTGVPVLFDDNAADGFLTDTDEIVAHLESEYA
jgi:Glutaredoxin and related proteins